MERSEVLCQRDDVPILLADGRMGLLILYPRKDDGLCGIQVHGEEAVRWVLCSDLEKSAFGAIRQKGAGMPLTPTKIDGENPRIAHAMLAIAWVRTAQDWIGVVQ